MPRDEAGVQEQWVGLKASHRAQGTEEKVASDTAPRQKMASITRKIKYVEQQIASQIWFAIKYQAPPLVETGTVAVLQPGGRSAQADRGQKPQRAQRKSG